MGGPGEKIEFFQCILLEHWVGSDLSLLISGGGRDDYNGGVFGRGKWEFQSWLLQADNCLCLSKLTVGHWTPAQPWFLIPLTLCCVLSPFGEEHQSCTTRALVSPGEVTGLLALGTRGSLSPPPLPARPGSSRVRTVFTCRLWRCQLSQHVTLDIWIFYLEH